MNDLDQHLISEDAPPAFKVGQRVRHIVWGEATVAGALRFGPAWLYDLAPSLDGGEFQIEGKLYSPGAMLDAMA